MSRESAQDLPRVERDDDAQATGTRSWSVRRRQRQLRYGESMYASSPRRADDPKVTIANQEIGHARTSPTGKPKRQPAAPPE
jgi:hypothetical protein